MDKIQAYRQPMVTATGILLGFILNFATTWVNSAFSRKTVIEVIVAVSLIACIIILIVVLYRILNMHYPKERAEEYYKKTLRLFVIGISIPFAVNFLVMIRSLVVNL